ncbi:MAG TPA: transcription termination/antitermination NusG family protein, partial [Candidatus Limnocylindrales bacterium]|nr:transcription termination/antitermination NusG family protein [Candidatus Limnocylindrales bacterium]
APAIGEHSPRMKAWYVLRTHPRAEEQVSRVLDAKGLPVFLPRLKSRPVRRATGQARWSTEPFFPGYLFSQLDVQAEDWLIARSAPGVQYVLGQHVGGHRVPTPVPDDLIGQLDARVERENEIRWDQSFRSGERVRILAGPFRSLEAVFDKRLSPSGRVQVFLHSLSRLVPLELNVNDLQRAR